MRLLPPSLRALQSRRARKVCPSRVESGGFGDEVNPRRWALQMMRRLKGCSGVLNVLSDVETPEPALYVAIDRCAGSLQVAAPPPFHCSA